MAKDPQKTGFQGALDSIKDAVADLSTLEVVTLRGKVTGDVTSVLAWEDLLKNATATGGELKLALATQIEFDCDVKTFIADEVPPQWIIDAHNASVQAGLKARETVLALIGDSVKRLLKK